MKLPLFCFSEVAVAALLTALALALPTHNSTGDAWYYAACARWGHELWQPHHLLYNGGGWLWLRLLRATGPPGSAALPWLQALNSLAYGGCLLALGPLLRWAGARAAAVPAWLLAVGSTFGMLRFAVENEAYIQPLLLALLASLAWALAQTEPASRATLAPPRGPRWPSGAGLLLAGLLAALACLLHQVMVWWWLGLLLGLRPWRGRAALGAGLAYAGPALLVPLAYALAAPAGTGALGVLRFALHDYLTGAARVELGYRSLLLTPIGLVRTLGQVHGNLLPLLRHWPLLGAVAAGCLALATYGMLSKKLINKRIGTTYQFLKASNAETSASENGAITPPAAAPASATWLHCTQRIRQTHLLIGALQLAFAALAAGNAEFMVMLPALAAVGLAGGGLRAWPARRVAALGGALLAWNLAFGLVPAHLLTYTAAGPVLRALVQQQPRAWFVLLDPNLLRNQLHYFTGQPLAPPRVLGLAGQDSARFRQWLRGRLAAGDTVYTDALGGPRPLDRARLTLGDLGPRLLGGVGARRVAVLPTFLGPVYLVRLLPGDTTLAVSSKSKARAATNTGAAK